MRKSGFLYLNGKPVEFTAQHAKMMLADYLRYERRLTGTKIVCSEGDCGACTVLRAFSGFAKQKPLYLPINSCITTVAQMDGSSLVTVDALSDQDQLVPVQSVLMNAHASQCGFCTPGFVMALAGLAEKKLALKDTKAKVSPSEAKNAFTGNLCRCTGYQPLIDAAVQLDLSACKSVRSRFFSLQQEKALRAIVKQPLHIKSPEFEFYAPTSIKEATRFLSKNTEAKVLTGATDLGVFHNKRKQRLSKTLSLHLIKELYEIKTLMGSRVWVGARVTLSELRRYLKTKLPELADFLNIFASPQIKNVATLIGNVANASPIADTPPFLLISDAVVEAFGPRGKRSIPIEEFFVDYRQTALRPGEFITAIHFSAKQKDEVLVLKKVSERKDLDISSVNAAFRLSWSDSKKIKIKDFRLALGGVAATPVRLRKTEAHLIGKSPDNDTLARAVEILQSEISPISDVRGSMPFRRVLTENIFRQFFFDISPKDSDPYEASRSIGPTS